MTINPDGRLLLVRHAQPDVDPAVPAERWPLSLDGRLAARRYAHLVPRPAYFVASPEPKAWQTLAELAGGQEVARDAGFAEVRRPHRWSPDDEYRATARAYLEGARHDGWEPYEEVLERFEAAVVRHAAVAGEATLVVGTHGLALTIWLVKRYRLVPSPAEFWAVLCFPELIQADISPPPPAVKPRYHSKLLRDIDARAEARGAARAEAQGIRRAVLKVLDARGVEVPDAIREQISACTDPAQLDIWLRRAATATTAAEVVAL